jgi:Tfp pilus assembly protein PilO
MSWLPLEPKARKQAAILMLALVCAVWYVAKMYALDPRQADVGFSATVLERLESQNEAAKEFIFQVDNLHASIELQERQLRIFEQFIPDAEEVPELLDAISREAQLTGVEITRLRPLSAEPVLFQGGGRAQASSAISSRQSS